MTEKINPSFEIKVRVLWDEEEEELRCEDLCIPGDLLDVCGGMKTVGTLFCVIGVDCRDGKINCQEES